MSTRRATRGPEMNYLRRRKNGAYDFRKRVLLDLVEQVGRVEFVKALGTTISALD